MTRVITLGIIVSFILAVDCMSALAVQQYARPVYRPDPPPNPKIHCRTICPSSHHATAPQSLTPEQRFEVEVYLFLGNKARDNHNYEEARKHYREVLQVDENEWRAYYGLGNVSYDEAFEPGKSALIAQAIEFYWSAVQRAPTNTYDAEVAELYSDLAQAYLYSKIPERLSLALQSVEKALRRDARSASATRRWGNLYFTQTKYQEALKKYLEAVRLEPNNARNHRALGAAYFQLQAYDKAINEFKDVISLDPGYREGYEDILAFYDGKPQRFNEAVEILKQAVERNPRGAEAIYHLAFAYFRFGNKPAAQQEYEKLKTIDRKRACDLKRAIPQLSGSC